MSFNFSIERNPSNSLNNNHFQDSFNPFQNLPPVSQKVHTVSQVLTSPFQGDYDQRKPFFKGPNKRLPDENFLTREDFQYDIDYDMDNEDKVLDSDKNSLQPVSVDRMDVDTTFDKELTSMNLMFCTDSNLAPEIPTDMLH